MHVQQLAICMLVAVSFATLNSRSLVVLKRVLRHCLGVGPGEFHRVSDILLQAPEFRLDLCFDLIDQT